MIRTFQNAFHLAHKIFGHGACLEFGVYVGKTFVWQAEQIKKKYPQDCLIGFDSWVGLPPESAGVWAPARHAEGKYASSKRIVRNKLQNIGMEHDPRIRFVDGFFEHSLTLQVQRSTPKPIFINIDVDIYGSTLELLDFVKPLLQIGTVIYFDDWKDPKDIRSGMWGEHLAWEDWSRDNPNIDTETIEINPVNQRYMIVTRIGKSLMPASKVAEIRYQAFEIANDNPTLYEKIKRKIKSFL